MHAYKTGNYGNSFMVNTPDKVATTMCMAVHKFLNSLVHFI